MGLGDYIHWTAIIRDMYNEINDQPTIEKKIKKIARHKMKNNKFGVTGCNKGNDNDKFKFYVNIIWKGNVLEHKQGKIIFKNNPYLTNDKNYPNIIYFQIQSDGYLEFDRQYNITKIYDETHVVKKYADTINLKKYSINGDIHLTQEEINNVEKYLPKEKFIFIEPQNHKLGRSYPFGKVQNIVNKLKDKIKFIQISPSKFNNKKTKFLENCITYKDKFSFREAIYFASKSNVSLVPHGGLSIGIACLNGKTIVTYPGLFDPEMTTYDNETVIKCFDDSHKCLRINLGCQICEEYFKKHDENIIINELLKFI